MSSINRPDRLDEVLLILGETLPNEDEENTPPATPHGTDDDVSSTYSSTNTSITSCSTSPNSDMDSMSDSSPGEKSPSRTEGDFLLEWKMKPVKGGCDNILLKGKKGNASLFYLKSGFENLLKSKEVLTKRGAVYLRQEPVEYTILENTYLSSTKTAMERLPSWHSLEPGNDDAHRAEEEGSPEELISTFFSLVEGSTETPFSPRLSLCCSETLKVQVNEFYEIRNASMAGSGAFATRDLHKGDVILMERQLIESDGYTLDERFANLDFLGKRIVLCLQPHCPPGQNLDVLTAIRLANSFKIPGGTAIFPVASRFNHKCRDKCTVEYNYDSRRGLMVFTVKAETVPAGMELTISYGGDPDSLYQRYGFLCNCGGCRGMTEERVKLLEAMTWR